VADARKADGCTHALDDVVGGEPGRLVENEQVLAAVQAAVDEANAKMSRVEQIKRFELLPEDWLPGGDELTPTMKLKRRPIADKYEAEIEGLYAKAK